MVIEEIVHALEHLMKQLLYDLPQFVRDALPVPTCIKTLDALPEVRIMCHTYIGNPFNYHSVTVRTLIK